MTNERDRIGRLLEGELAEITHAGARERVAALITEPTPMHCAWDYGAPGQIYPCWKVAEDKALGIGVVYCEQGFGPRTPWGLIWLGGPAPSMGQDSGWFSTFREAAADILDMPAADLNA